MTDVRARLLEQLDAMLSSQWITEPFTLAVSITMLRELRALLAAGGQPPPKIEPRDKPQGIMDLPYERVDDEQLLAAIALWKDEHLLVLRPFGWHLDGKHIPNAAEHFSREGVCEDHGLNVVCDYGPYIAIVKSQSTKAAAEGQPQEAPPGERKHTEACLIRMGRGNFSCSCHDDVEPADAHPTPQEPREDPKIAALLREAYMYPRATLPAELVPDLADALKTAMADRAALRAQIEALRDDLRQRAESGAESFGLDMKTTIPWEVAERLSRLLEPDGK